jgi:hypothetical protein
MKKKPAMTVEECTERLQAVTGALVSERAPPEMIVEALVHVAINAGLKHRKPDDLFDRAANAFLTAADGVFEQAKKDRAEKRARRLGLTDD